MFRSLASRWLLGSGLVIGATVAFPSHALADGPTTVEFASCSHQVSTITVGKAVAKPGETVNVPVVFQPAAGWVIETKLSTSLIVFPPAGISAPQRRMKSQDAALNAQVGRFEVALSGTELGKTIVPGVLNFMVCRHEEALCEPQIAKVFIEIEVQ